MNATYREGDRERANHNTLAGQAGHRQMHQRGTYCYLILAYYTAP